MKRYTKPLRPTIQKLITKNNHQFEQLTAQGLDGLGRISGTMTIEESVAKYNPGITEDEIKAWVWYRKQTGIPMHSWAKYFIPKNDNATLARWIKSGVLFVIGDGNFVPYPVFVFGNIYTRLAKIKKLEDYITQNFGQTVYEKHIKVLEENKPKVISIQNPSSKERPIILAISQFTLDFQVSELAPDSDLVLPEPTSLREAYKDWLRTLSDEHFDKSNAINIINYYLNGEPKARSIDKLEWQQIQKTSRDEGEALFSQFLHTQLTHRDKVRIDAHYNSTYNAYPPLQYHKIPIGLEISKSFHGFDLDVRPAQREGIAFMELVGSGTIAYDVGVGKTITAIVEAVNAIKTGKCKRPLVIVPNPTYKNWLKEMQGFDGLAGILTGTGIQVNDWFNLGTDIVKSIKLDEALPEGSITLVTYEGFNKIGFDTDTARDMILELTYILSQTEDKSDREKEKEREKFNSIIGVGLKETIADVEVLGFDHLTVDEAHNYKNVFSEVKSRKDDKKRFHIKGGKPSTRATKLFFIANYIQRKYGRNVMLLTATPFTNSPLEIYSMLSFTSYDYMKSWGLYNINDFFEQYIQETTEYVVGVDGEIKEKNVVKSFNNRISLQKLIHSKINFKTGEEANIPRPCKINLPRTHSDGIKLPPKDQVLTYLQMTPEQEANQFLINSSAAEGMNKDDPGRLLRLMSESLNNALSPYIYDRTLPETYTEFVENSPKINYALKCIASVKKWHEKRNTEVSGQIIYMDRGKDYFRYIKEYLEVELGYKKNVPLKSNSRQKVDEVEVISGGISTTAKEKIKTAFNEGVCKIIIGTSTIKEGINLQKKSTVLYNLYPNWNPTDLRQLEGRLWRQKNENGFVRIVIPLMENSMDVFVFQKLEEKTSRINDIWAKGDRGNVLDEDSLDPNAVKFALVTDIGVLTRFEIKQIKEEVRRRKFIIEKNIEDLENFNSLRANYTRFRENVFNALTHFDMGSVPVFGRQATGTVYYRNLGNIDTKQFSQDKRAKIKSLQDFESKLKTFLNSEYTDKELIAFKTRANRLSGQFYDHDLNRFKETFAMYTKIKKSVIEGRGYTEADDISVILDSLKTDLQKTNIEWEEVESDEFYQKVGEDIAKQKEAQQIKGGTLDERVKEFENLNHLLSYKFSDIEPGTCSVPTKEKKREPKTDTSKAKRIAIAKAKAKAIRLRIKISKLL